MLRDTIGDLRYALRQLRKSPAFTAAAVSTLALGIGANAAIYSVIDAALFRPLPYAQPERLITLWVGDPGEASFYSFSYPGFQLFREHSLQFVDLAAYDDEIVSFSDRSDPERLEGGRVSANFFSVMGIAPELGRGFLPEEDAHGARPVALLSDRYWRARYHADRGVLGRAVRIDSEEFTIIGVMPPGFQFRNAPVDVWRSRIVDTRTYSPESVRLGAAYLTVVGRLRADMSPAVMQARFRSIDGGKDRPYADFLENQIFATVRRPLLVLWGAVACLLLIACANVANLVLARASGRHREVAIRMALGAGRLRIACQLLAEGVLLSLCGGLAAVPVASWSMSLLAAGIRRAMSAIPEPHLDLRVMAVTFAIASAIGMAFGLAPLLLLVRGKTEASLHSGGRATSASAWSIRFREALVAGEVALCVVLLTAAGLLGQSFLRMSTIGSGFRADKTVMVPLDLMPDRYASWDARGRFYDEVLRRTAATPGVTAAAITSRIDLVQHGLGYMIGVEGGQEMRPGNPGARGRSVSPDYFSVLGIPLLRGRAFTAQDSVTAPKVMMVNETFAKRFLAGRDPIGVHVTYSTDRIRCDIVGLVRDVRFATQADAEPTMYLPLAQRPWLVARLLVLSDSPAAVMSAIRKQIQAVDPDQAVAGARLLNDVMADTLGQPRTTMFSVIVFASLAVLLGAVGIYGVTAYTVAQRAREIAIRIALGADGRGVRGLVFRQTLRVLAAGLGAGVPLAAGSSRVYASLLFGMRSAGPAILLVVAGVLAIVTVAASSGPAVQAAAIDPASSLRAE